MRSDQSPTAQSVSVSSVAKSPASMRQTATGMRAAMVTSQPREKNPAARQKRVEARKVAWAKVLLVSMDLVYPTRRGLFTIRR